MPTLSQVTLETRAILKWAGIILGALIIIFLLLKIKDAFFPTPPPGPSVSFGKLPSIDFPAQSGKTFTYSIDTISGGLPFFPSVEKVFKMEDSLPDLLSLPKAQQLAKGIGFTSNPQEISPNIYQWSDSSGDLLTMNILSYNFNFSSNNLFKSALPNYKNTDEAISLSREFLKNINLYPNDLDENNVTTGFLMVKDYKLASVSAVSDSQAVRVNFHQQAVNELPIYYPESLVSPMNFIIGGQKPSILNATFFHQSVSDVSATYPIKTADEAFSDLKNGKALITEAPNSSQIAIKKVGLGYYISEKKQLYLLPVIVFDGDNFEALVSAVRDEWVNK